jgi:hypothetical protein
MPEPKNPPFKKRLVITAQRELATFKRNNEDAVLYEVEAVNEDGKKIEKLLRTFHAELPQGELLDFQVSEYVHEKYGQTFMLKLPSKGRASKKDITDIRNQLSAVADRVGALESQFASMQAEMSRNEELDARFGREPPF